MAKGSVLGSLLPPLLQSLDDLDKVQRWLAWIVDHTRAYSVHLCWECTILW
jgi:hypothetical protein